ncbi:unnamed protein product [Periconia digitata]|uniref:Uncharacterized protein n=1 Tax=Periconia digitata TaxID=1303443 RepID=A0A9W4UQC7_9PLEO|nr:unnamed protein product [Periconia digitata]
MSRNHEYPRHDSLPLYTIRRCNVDNAAFSREVSREKEEKPRVSITAMDHDMTLDRLHVAKAASEISAFRPCATARWSQRRAKFRTGARPRPRALPSVVC